MPRPSAVVALIVAAMALYGPTMAPDATPPADECAVYRSEGDGVLTFAGSGDVVTEPFEVRAGSAIVAVDADGSFNMDFYEWPGDGITVGPYLGDGGESQDVVRFDAAATYVMDVDGEGDWTVTIDQG